MRERKRERMRESERMMMTASLRLEYRLNAAFSLSLSPAEGDFIVGEKFDGSER